MQQRERQRYVEERLRSEDDKTRNLSTNLIRIPEKEKKR